MSRRTHVPRHASPPTGPRRRRLAPLLLASAVLALVGAALAPAAGAATPGVLTGTVTGSDGRPLANVKVSFVVPNLTNGGQSEFRSTRTTTAGRYTFTGDLTTTGVLLQFYGAGATGGTSATGYGDVCYGSANPLCWFGTSGTAVIVKDGQRRTVNATLPRAGVATGRAVDAVGRSVGGIGVTIWPGDPDFMPDAFTGPVVGTRTDSNGHYRVPLDAYDYYTVCFGQPDTVQFGPTPATKFGYVGACAAKTVVKAGGTSVANATLAHGAGLAGVVVANTTGKPVVGATVTVQTPYTGLTNLPQSATTTSTGAFSLLGITPGPGATWCVDAPNFKELCSAQPLTLSSDTITSLGTLKLVQRS